MPQSLFRLSIDYFLNQKLEPLENGLNTELLESFALKFPTWSGLVDDVRTYWQSTKDLFYIPNLLASQYQS